MDFESTAENLKTVDESGLSQVSKLAKQQLQLENSISELELQLKEAKINLREISQEKLPSAMAEHSIQELKLDDGSTIQVKPFYRASITKEKQGEAFKWLVDNGFGDLIKNVVSTSFVRGQEEKAEKLVEELSQRDMSVSTKKWVEPMTLKGWVREQIESGAELPQDLLGVYIGEETKIKR
jgi:hypothetical protein